MKASDLEKQWGDDLQKRGVFNEPTMPHNIEKYIEEKAQKMIVEYGLCDCDLDLIALKKDLAEVFGYAIEEAEKVKPEERNEEEYDHLSNHNRGFNQGISEYQQAIKKLKINNLHG